MNFLRRSDPAAQEFINGGANFALWPQAGIALEGAFTGHFNEVDAAHAAEILKERTICQAAGKPAIILFEEKARDRATQGAAAVQLAVLLGAGGELFLRGGAPPFQIRADELLLQAGGEEQLVDAQELIAKIAIIGIAVDGGQHLRKFRLKGKNSGASHYASLYSSFTNAN